MTDVPPTQATWQAKLRRSLALLLVVLFAFAFAYARCDDQFEQCTTIVRHEGSVSAKQTTEVRCEPVGIEIMLPGVVLALALLWPDLTSIEVFGLGRIARRLNDQDSRQNELEAAQLRLETTVQAGAAAHSSVVLSFASNPAVAHAIEAAVTGQAHTQVTSGPPTTAQVESPYELFERASKPLRPWLAVAQRLADPAFSAAVEAGAATGRPADSQALLPRDVVLLRRVERPGRPFAIDQLRNWTEENALQIESVRETMRVGSASSPESLGVATRFAEQLLSDLKRRELLPS